jgi:protein-arginine kinase activator protein McsA
MAKDSQCERCGDAPATSVQTVIPATGPGRGWHVCEPCGAAVAVQCAYSPGAFPVAVARVPL